MTEPADVTRPPALEVADVAKSYGSLSVFRSVSLAVAALKASGNPKDGAAVASALGGLKGQAITGDYDFTSGPVPHVSQVPELIAQWRLVSGSPQLVVINNSLLPAVPVAGSLQLL